MTKRILPIFLAMLLFLQTTACAAESKPGQITGFVDIAADAPYAEAVAWCREKGIMNGVTDTSFDPEGTLTRAMLVTALYRAAQEPAVDGAPAFSDTQEESWYANAVVWADSTGIMTGYGNDLFGTNDPVTKEQLDVILRRYQGENPVWVGDPLRNTPATRAGVAAALYNGLMTPPVEEEPTVNGGNKVLVAYFSATNNTKGIAEKIAAATSGDLFPIEAQVPYTAADRNYNDPASRTQVEQRDDTLRPEITGTVSNLDDYSVIFLGYPIWNGKAPKVIYTFLENSGDWSGKTIVPFCTSGSSPIGSSAMNLYSLISEEANWLDGSRFSAGASQETVTSWVESLNLDWGKEAATVTKIDLIFHGYTYPATLEENTSARAFVELLQEKGGALTVEMSDYGGFEKVGSLGTLLPRNDAQITTSAGDIILYQGNSITVYYAQNSWNFTRLGRLDDPSGLREALGSGSVSITFQLADK